MPYLFYLAILALSALLSAVGGALPQHAKADSLTSARTYLGMGHRTADSGDKLFADLGLVGDVTFGRAKPKAFRVGPALELRTVNFQTLEAAVGPAILLPLPGEMYIGLYPMIGAAVRKHAPDGMTGIGKVTFGFRAYPYNSWYGYGLNFFGSGRKALNTKANDGLVEWAGGVEVDIEFTVITPLLFMKNLVTAHDPYEEGEEKHEDDEEAQDEPSSDDDDRDADSDDEESSDDDDEESSSSSKKSDNLDNEKPPGLSSGDDEEEEE